MALKSTLGFGMMRLPVKNGNPTDFDYDELNRMVDTYLEAGYNYFDTSFVYHNGKTTTSTHPSFTTTARVRKPSARPWWSGTREKASALPPSFRPSS